MSTDRDDLVALVMFLVIAALVGADLVSDFMEGSDWTHVGVESIGAIVALGGAARAWIQWRRRQQLSRVALEAAEGRAEVWKAEADLWRAQAQEALAGLSMAIDGQFQKWRLSPAEAEVGMLLLKGLSLKEVAAVRGTSERTTREQARAIYRKAGLGGRAELSAFFLEDLLLPVNDR